MKATFSSVAFITYCILIRYGVRSLIPKELDVIFDVFFLSAIRADEMLPTR